MPKNSWAAEPSALLVLNDSDALPTLTRQGVVQYCAELGLTVTERWIRQHSQDGTLPSFLVRNQVMFSRADVRGFLLSLRRG